MMAEQSNKPSLKKVNFKWQRDLATLIGIASFAVSLSASAQDATTAEANKAANPAVQAPLDYTVYTTYTLSSDHTTVYWEVVGFFKKTSGVYGKGSFGPLGKVGSLVEGSPIEDLKKKTVTRYIYVLDIAAGNEQNGVNLNVYKKTDYIKGSEDKVSVTLVNVIALPLVGGTSATVSMAANGEFVFVGTDQGPLIAEVTKKTLAVAQINYQPSPYFVTGITANLYGYVTVGFNIPEGGANNSLVIAPDGTLLLSSGGTVFMSNPIEATNPYSLQ
jgi:hypothetical protein